MVSIQKLLYNKTWHKEICLWKLSNFADIVIQIGVKWELKSFSFYRHKLSGAHITVVDIICWKLIWNLTYCYKTQADFDFWIGKSLDWFDSYQEAF